MLLNYPSKEIISVRLFKAVIDAPDAIESTILPLPKGMQGSNATLILAE